MIHLVSRHYRPAWYISPQKFYVKLFFFETRKQLLTIKIRYFIIFRNILIYMQLQSILFLSQFINIIFFIRIKSGTRWIIFISKEKKLALNEDYLVIICLLIRKTRKNKFSVCDIGNRSDIKSFLRSAHKKIILS